MRNPAIAFVFNETLVAPTQLLGRGGEDGGAVVSVLSPLLFVEADDVTALLDFDFLDLERRRVFGALVLGGEFLSARTA